jgi:hypothetical protein
VQGLGATAMFGPASGVYRYVAAEDWSWKTTDSTTLDFQLSPGTGTKTVYAEFKDLTGPILRTQATVTLATGDTTPPGSGHEPLGARRHELLGVHVLERAGRRRSDRHRNELRDPPRHRADQRDDVELGNANAGRAGPAARGHDAELHRNRSRLRHDLLLRAPSNR